MDSIIDTVLKIYIFKEAIGGRRFNFQERPKKISNFQLVTFPMKATPTPKKQKFSDPNFLFILDYYYSKKCWKLLVQNKNLNILEYCITQHVFVWLFFFVKFKKENFETFLPLLFFWTIHESNRKKMRGVITNSKKLKIVGPK